MALVIADRIKGRSHSTGTGDYLLTSSVASFRGFIDGIGANNTAYYFAVLGDDWEAGIGTVRSSPERLERTIIQASSQGGAPINWGGGSKTVTAGWTAGLINSILTSIAVHVADTNNPHGVTKAQVGLGSADNTSDLDKPLSTAAIAALAPKITASSVDTLINKSINAANNTITNITLAMFAANVVDPDGTGAANSDLRVMTQKAVMTLFGTVSGGTGSNFKNSVRARATSGTIATDFENGDTVGGVVVATGDRIFIDNSLATAGAYTVNASGAPTRATDMDAAGEFISAVIPVLEGTYANTLWICTTPAPITVGTTPVTFTQIPSAGAYSQGNGITISSNVISANLAYAHVWTAAQGIILSAAGKALNLQSTAAGASSGPDIEQYRNKAAGVAADIIAGHDVAGSSSTGVKRVYSRDETRIVTATNGAEDGLRALQTIRGGTVADRFIVGSGLYAPTATGGDLGAGTANLKGASIDNVPLLTPDTTALSTLTGSEPTPARTARSLRQFWSDQIDVAEFGADPTGVATNFDVVLTNAIAEAIARTRHVIRIRRAGRYKLGASTVSLINAVSANKQIKIVGDQHPQGVVRIQNSQATGTWFSIGNISTGTGDKTTGIVFEGIYFGAAVTITADEMFKLRNTSGITFIGCQFDSYRRAFDLGDRASAIATVEAANYTDIIDCSFSPQGYALAGDRVSGIRLGAATSLNIKGGGRDNAPSGSNLCGAFIGQDALSFASSDGIYIFDRFMEGFPTYCDFSGRGVSQLVWRNGQVDRPTATAFNFTPVSGGTCKQCSIIGVNMLRSESDTVVSSPVLWQGSGAGEGVCQDLVFSLNSLKGFTSYAYFKNGTVNANGNEFHNCGRGTGAGGTPLIRTAAKGIINNNTSLTDAGTTQPTYGIQFDAPAGNRSRTGNQWNNVSVATEVGTP